MTIKEFRELAEQKGSYLTKYTANNTQEYEILFTSDNKVYVLDGKVKQITKFKHDKKDGLLKLNDSNVPGIPVQPNFNQNLIELVKTCVTPLMEIKKAARAEQAKEKPNYMSELSRANEARKTAERNTETAVNNLWDVNSMRVIAETERKELNRKVKELERKIEGLEEKEEERKERMNKVGDATINQYYALGAERDGLEKVVNNTDSKKKHGKLKKSIACAIAAAAVAVVAFVGGCHLIKYGNHEKVGNNDINVNVTINQDGGSGDQGSTGDTTEEPTVDNPTVDDPTTDDPTVEDPSIGGTTTDKATLEETVNEAVGEEVTIIYQEELSDETIVYATNEDSSKLYEVSVVEVDGMYDAVVEKTSVEFSTYFAGYLDDALIEKAASRLSKNYGSDSSSTFYIDSTVRSPLSTNGRVYYGVDVDTTCVNYNESGEVTSINDIDTLSAVTTNAGFDSLDATAASVLKLIGGQGNVSGSYTYIDPEDSIILQDYSK